MTGEGTGGTGGDGEFRESALTGSEGNGDAKQQVSELIPPTS